MEYNILSANSPQELIEQVNQAIKEGWKPQGGLVMVVTQHATPQNKGYAFSSQAMVRQSKNHSGIVVGNPDEDDD